MALIDRIIEREDMLDRIADAVRRTDVQRCSYCGATSCPHSFNSSERVWNQSHDVPQPVYEHGSWR